MVFTVSVPLLMSSSEPSLNWPGWQFTANAAIGCSSLNLMLRPYVVMVISTVDAIY